MPKHYKKGDRLYMEDMILNEMINQDQGSGMNLFSERTQDKGHRYDYMFDERTGQDMTEMVRAQQSLPFYDEARDKYVNRDRSKYGRLSFEDFVMGLTPDEEYITSLGSEEPSEVSLLWNEAFGEDTELMKRAALHYGAAVNNSDYPDRDTSPYPDGHSRYNQGR